MTPNAVRFTILPGYLTEEVGVFCMARSVMVSTDGGGLFDMARPGNAVLLLA